MIIQNRVSGSPAAYLPPVTTQPVQGASAGASATSAASGNSFISYAQPHAVSKLSAAHERGPLSFSLKPGEQAGNASGTPLQATLTKIAQLLRDIFQRLLSPLQHAQSGAAIQGGQQAYGKPVSSPQPHAVLHNLSQSERGQNKATDNHLADDRSAGNNPVIYSPAARSTSGEASQPKAMPQPEINTTHKLPSLTAKYDITPSPVPQPTKDVSPHVAVKEGADKVLAANATTKSPVPQPTQPASPRAAAKGSNGDGLAGITGYAKAANTTGGSGGKVVTVSTVDELEKNLTGDEPTTIKLAKSLSASDKTVIKFGANKTLEGTSQGMGLNNIYLASDKTAGNDVFRNLDFTHDARYRANGDIPLFISNGQGYWIDHNTFSGTKSKDATGLDKLLYVGGTADNVTLSNSEFKDNEYGVILGQPDDSDASAQKYGGYPRMTIANNIFNNIDVRSPGLMREGKFDVYNNLIDNYNLGFTLAKNATVFSQANYFENGYDMNNRSSSSGSLNDYGNALGFRDVGSNVSFLQTSKGSASAPVEYSRSVMTAEAARNYDLANAGAGK
ncbi:type III effector [Erwinia amylovora]|uniref:pectate lyase family protein n=1 Tax=Erwinia amylovora TaxID=552 RepID=UPI001443AD4B|nr:type III effector [Erwinia amylovora]